MALIDTPPRNTQKQTGIDLQIFWITLTGVIFVVLAGLAYLRQFDLLFGVIFLTILVFLFFHSPISGVAVLLVMSAMIGFFSRLALYLAKGPAAFDFIRASVELGAILYAYRAFRSSPPFRKRTVHIVNLLVIAYLVISTLYTFDIIYAPPLMTIWGWRWVCIPILLFFVGRTVGQKENTLPLFYKMLVVLLLILSSYAVFQAAIGLPVFDRYWFERLPNTEQASSIIEGSFFIAGKPRIPSMTQGHVSFTLLSGYLFLLVLFIPDYMLSKNYKRLRLLALFVTGLYLFITLERSAIGMIGLGIGVAVFMKMRWKVGRISIILLSIIGLAGGFLVNSIDPSQIPWTKDTIAFRRVFELANPARANTVVGRAKVVWPQALQRLFENPLGYGLGTFHTTSQNQKLDFSFFIPPHNMYLQIILETGIIGLIVFVLLILVYVRVLLRARLRREDRNITIGAITSLTAILAIAMVNYPLELPVAFFFWFLMGITVTYVSQHKETGRNTS
jgi:O-antigen ligase